MMSRFDGMDYDTTQSLIAKEIARIEKLKLAENPDPKTNRSRRIPIHLFFLEGMASAGERQGYFSDNQMGRLETALKVAENPLQEEDDSAQPTPFPEDHGTVSAQLFIIDKQLDAAYEAHRRNDTGDLCVAVNEIWNAAASLLDVSKP